MTSQSEIDLKSAFRSDDVQWTILFLNRSICSYQNADWQRKKENIVDCVIYKLVVKNIPFSCNICNLISCKATILKYSERSIMNTKLLRNHFVYLTLKMEYCCSILAGAVVYSLSILHRVQKRFTLFRLWGFVF